MNKFNLLSDYAENSEGISFLWYFCVGYWIYIWNQHSLKLDSALCSHNLINHSTYTVAWETLTISVHYTKKQCIVNKHCNEYITYLHGTLSIITVPVCRGGCHERSRGTVGKVHNTLLAPAKPPGRSTELQLQSDYNRLHRQLGKKQQIWKKQEQSRWIQDNYFQNLSLPTCLLVIICKYL